MLWWSGRLLVLAALLTAAALDTEEIQKEDEHLVLVAAGPGPGPPENVIATPVGSTALNVSWDPPEEPPLYYIVRIDSESIENDTSNTYFLVEGLEPCQDYYIRVLSRYNGNQYTAKATGTTNTPVPPSPQTCWFSDVHTSTLDINWNDTQFKCAIVGHRISWLLDVLGSDEESTNQTTTTDHQIHLTNLPPYTNVTASVEAESKTGYSQPTTCWNVTDHDSPGPPENVIATPVGSTALNVSWDPPEEPPLYYIVRIDSDPIGNDTNNTYFLVEGLEPCQYYDIRVLSRYNDRQFVAKVSGTTNTPGNSSAPAVVDLEFV
ncbi:receptor-type tyrosine-protein phosphatase H isoform X2 [Procambarus clarkii]|uniref:receptor-type tyrosine-protein phosphatase H isoform X2 n=1 Tax=Procambarus clarkii TaxID=6728 RepID=UPI00374201FB